MQEFNLENDEVIKKSNEFKKKYLQNDLLKIDAQIWKILLKEKSKVIGNEVLYKELKDKCNLHGFDIVSYNTFLNAWINFDSESNRTSYRHLKILCEYLDLEKEYRYFLRVYCKTEANKARQSTIFHTEIINTLILPKLKNDENLNVFQLTENQKSSLILMGISEDNIQEKLNCYLEETKNIISKRTKKLINISKI